MKISVIMPSYLGEFPNCSPNRPQKFIRAVDSFLAQGHKDKELIIISDGCERTNDIVKKKYSKMPQIRLLELSRHELFTGAVRQAGIDEAQGDAVCNLDSDDYFLPHHLAAIAGGFDIENYDFCYWNHRTKPDLLKNVDYYTQVLPELGLLNNGNIAWKRNLDVSWVGCDGLHDNQIFIKRLLDKYPPETRGQKIYGAGYVISHLLISKAPDEAPTAAI